MIRTTRPVSASPLAMTATAVLSLFLMLQGCSSPTQTPEERIQQAKDFRAKGKHKEAMIELRNVLQTNPNHPQANWLIAETYLDMGNPFMAETALKKAQEGGVSANALKLPLAKSLYYQGKAEEAFRAAEPGQDDSLDLRLKLMTVQGESLMALGRLEQACGRYEAMRQLKGDSAGAALGLSRCAAARQDFALSRKLTEDAIRFDPKDAEARVQLGHIERGQGHLAEAEGAYGKALEIAPRHVDALLGRAMVLLKQRKFDAARADINTALTAAPSSPLPTHLLGVEAHLRGQHKEAKIHFQKVLKVMPEYLPSLYWQAITDTYLGNLEQAVKALTLYVTRQPRDQMAKVVLASVQARQGNKATAEENLKALRELGLEDAALLGMTGQTYLALGKSAEAQRYLRVAQEKNPKDLGLKLTLAESYRQQKQYDAYLKELAEAVAMAPQSMPLRGQLAMALNAQGKPDKARAEIAEMRRLAPKSTEPLFLQAGMQLQAQDWPGARKSFEEMLKLNPDSADAHMNLARLDLREGKVDAAKQRFLALHKRNDKDMAALLGLAGLAYARNDLKEQREWLEKAVKANPKAIGPLMQLAQNLLATGQPQQALALANQAHGAEPGNPAALQLLGDVQFASGAYANARSSYTKLTELQPGSATAFYKLAEAQDRAGFAKEAIQAMAKAASLSPGEMSARLALANLEAKRGNFAEAHKIANGLKKDFPKRSAGHLLDGEMFLAEKKSSEALKQFEQGLAIQPTPVLVNRAAQAQASLGQAAAAETRLQKWLKAQPNDPLVRAELAGLYVRQGKLDQAIAEYEVMVKAAPNQATLLNDLAWLLQRRGNGQRALALAEQAYKLAPNIPAVQDTLGWTLVQQGQGKRGLELLAKAAQAAPKSPGIRYHHAAALAQSGDKAGARKILEPLLAEKTPFAERDQATALLKSL